jgi:hypothetical protein
MHMYGAGVALWDVWMGSELGDWGRRGRLGDLGVEMRDSRFKIRDVR